jgi:hypothetical protein
MFPIFSSALFLLSPQFSSKHHLRSLQNLFSTLPLLHYFYKLQNPLQLHSNLTRQPKKFQNFLITPHSSAVSQITHQSSKSLSSLNLRMQINANNSFIIHLCLPHFVAMAIDTSPTTSFSIHLFSRSAAPFKVRGEGWKKIPSISIDVKLIRFSCLK